MGLKYTYHSTDGALHIVHAAAKEAIGAWMTDEEYETNVYVKSIPEGAVNVTKMPDDWQPPEDRTFRSAWKQSNNGVAVDMPKARYIWREKMRKARAPKLAALDVEYMRADELGDSLKKSEAASKKSQLRDVTDLPDIESATTPEELMSVWPEILD